MLNNLGFGNYKSNEKTKYDNFLSDLEDLKFPIYILSGENYWKKHVLDKMSTIMGGRPDIIRENLKDFLDRIRFRSLKGRKHFYTYETKGNKMKESDFILLKSYLSNPSEFGVLVIQLKDWKEKQYFLKNFKMITKSNKIKFFDMDFVSDYFKKLHILDLLNEEKIEFSNDKLRNDVIKNLGLNLSEVIDNILTLKSLEKVITKEDYEESIEKYNDNSIEKFYSSLSKLNRKKVPYEILKDLLDEGESPQKIMKGIENYFNLLYQAKYYRINGLLRPGDVESEKIKHIESLNLNFKGTDLLTISKNKRLKYLEDCADITLKEIIQVQLIIERSYHTNILEKKVDEFIEKRYVKYLDKERLYSCVLNIMNRREES